MERTQYYQKTRMMDRRLDRAVEYVNDLWMPCNLKLYERVQTRLDGGDAGRDFDQILNEIQGDVSLFTFALRELVILLKKEGVEIPESTAPIDLLRQAGVDKLRTVFSRSSQGVSKHFFSSGTEEQMARINEVVLSASAATVMAPSYQIEPSLGYTAAILRQIGYVLISWNYPTIYRKALNSQTADKSLDLILAELLGFSPQLLAVKVIKSWGVPTNFCANLGMTEEDDDDMREVAQILGKSLSRLCSVTEALARANDPERYPRAHHDWDLAKEEVFKRLGKDALKTIQSVFDENMHQYMGDMPHLFRGGLYVDPEIRIAEVQHSRTMSSNPFVRLCDQSLQDEFVKLYSLIDASARVEDRLRLLLREICPKAGFSGGCIYTADPGIAMLLPQTKMGEVKLRELSPIPYSRVLVNEDSIARVFQNGDGAQLIKPTLGSDGGVGLAGILGYSSRLGVLYLEASDLASKEYSSRLDVFRAIAVGLSDALGLR